jgi:hypothetical protein
MSESGSPVPAANQPTHADAPGSGAPTDHDGRDPEPGTSGATEGRGPQGGSAAPETDVNASPGDSAGVSVPSADSSLGTSEAGQPIQSTGELVTEEARRPAGVADPSTDPDSAAPRDSAVPPD